MNYPRTREKGMTGKLWNCTTLGKKQPEIGRIKLALQRDGATSD